MKTLKTFRNILGISLVASSILLANENAAIQEKPKIKQNTIFKAKVKTNKIDSRMQPSINSKAVDSYRQDRILNVLGVLTDKNGERWAKIGKNEYLSFKHLEIQNESVKSNKKEIKQDTQKLSNKIKYKFHIDNKGVTFEDLGIEEKWLREAVVQYEIQDFSKQSLQEMADVVSFYFQYHGYPSATAYIPSQEIDQSNTITINIVIGNLGKYIVANESIQVKDSAISSKLNEALKGKMLTVYNIEDNIYKVNRLAGIEAVALIQAGDKYGDTDVVISAIDTLKARASLFADNYGIESSGAYRLGASFTFNNLLGYGDSFDAFLQVTNELQKNFGLSYNFFIDNFRITPRISKSNYSLGGIYEQIGATGESTNIGIDINYPLWLNSFYGLEFIAGYDKKNLRDSYEDFNIHYKKEADVFYLGYSGYYNTTRNRFNANFKLSFGDISPKSFYSENFSNTNGAFSKFSLNLYNNYFINEKLTLISTLNYQQSLNKSKKLDSSETSYLGGAYGVRAYRSGEGDADNSVYAMLGVRYNTPINNFYVTPFYEAGYSWNQDKEYEETLLDSMGVELLYMKPNDYYIKVDLAQAVNKYKYDGKRRDRLYLGMGIYF